MESTILVCSLYYELASRMLRQVRGEREGGGWEGGWGERGHAQGSNCVVTKDFRQLNSCGPWEKKKVSVCSPYWYPYDLHIFCAFPH